MRHYLQPQTKIELTECETMLAASKFDSTNNAGTQSVTPSNVEYNGEFSVKEFLWDNSDE